MSSSGLVRRRTAAETSADLNGSSAASNDFNDNFKNETDNDNLEETSDKETRLTLMEEVLLLGLKDKEVGRWFSLVSSSLIPDLCLVGTSSQSMFRVKRNK